MDLHIVSYWSSHTTNNIHRHHGFHLPFFFSPLHPLLFFLSLTLSLGIRFFRGPTWGLRPWKINNILVKKWRTVQNNLGTVVQAENLKDGIFLYPSPTRACTWEGWTIFYILFILEHVPKKDWIFSLSQSL